jgi:WD40 repeat protein
VVVLPVVPLRERVVEIEAALGTGLAERYRYGSGFRLGGRLVLTAAHVVAGAAAAGIVVRGPDKVPHPARVVDVLAGDPDAVDLALLELCDQTAELPAPPVAVVDRDVPVPAPVEGCWAVGYPLFQEVRSAAGVVRETAQVWGMILPAENLVGELLSLHVTSAPRELPPQQEAWGESPWSGMSGAAVLAGERLIGVVSEHAPRRGKSTITVTPLASLNRLPAAAAGQWWAHLAADPDQLVMLPARRERAEPAYRSTLRQLRARTGVLRGREVELEAVGAFAAGLPSALAPPGSQHAWLVGGPWAGKTALLAEAVHALPPEVDCVAYFLTQPTGDADRERFLAAVVPQLAWLLDTDPPSPPDEHVFRQLWEQAAQRAADEGRQLLLIVDGLDEDLRPGGHSVAGWLPGRLPGLPAQVLVASRKYPRLPDDVDPAHPLSTLTPDKLYTLSDSPHAARLRDLADQEITQLLRRAGDDLVLDVLGLLTAARGGPLAAADLAELTGSPPWKVRGVLDGAAARTLQQVRPVNTPRYTFAHETLLARCQQHGVGDPGHTRRIDEWAATWRDRGWPAARDGEQGTPLYLLDRYPRTLYEDPPRLAALVGDVGWVTAAIRTLGVDAVLAELRTAGPAAPGEPRLAAMHAAVRGQAHHLRDWKAVGYPGFVPRQLCLQVTELGEAELYETDLAGDFRERLSAYPGLIPQWTSRRPHRALVAEVNGHAGWVNAVALTPDGNVVAGTDDGRVWIWDPSATAVGVVTLGYHDGPVRALVVDKNGRVVSGGHDHRIRLWDPLLMGAEPVELGQHDGAVRALAIDDENGRVISGGDDARVLVWDEYALEAGPIALGRHAGAVRSVAVGPGGLVVSGGDDHRARLWDQSRPGVIVNQTKRLGGRIMTVAMAPDCSVVMAGTDSMLYRWHPRFSDPLPDSDPPSARSDHRPAEFGSHHNVVRAVSIVRDEMVVSGGDDGRVLLWQTRDRRIDRIAIGHHDGSVRAVAGVPDDRAISGGQDQRVRIWDLREPRLSVTESGIPTGPANAVCISPDGCVLVGGADKRGPVWMWDSADAAAPVELGCHDSPVVAITALPEGRIMSCGADGRLFAWDRAEPGKAWVRPLSCWAGTLARSYALSPATGWSVVATTGGSAGGMPFKAADRSYWAPIQDQSRLSQRWRTGALSAAEPLVTSGFGTRTPQERTRSK